MLQNEDRIGHGFIAKVRSSLQLCRQPLHQCTCPWLSAGLQCGSWYWPLLGDLVPAWLSGCHTPEHTDPETSPTTLSARTGQCNAMLGPQIFGMYAGVSKPRPCCMAAMSCLLKEQAARNLKMRLCLSSYYRMNTQVLNVSYNRI